MEPRSFTISPFLLLHQPKLDKYFFIVCMNAQYLVPNSLMLAIFSGGALMEEEKNVPRSVRHWSRVRVRS